MRRVVAIKLVAQHCTYNYQPLQLLCAQFLGTATADDPLHTRADRRRGRREAAADQAQELLEGAGLACEVGPMFMAVPTGLQWVHLVR
jgi:transcriptional regulator of met regulon